MVPVCLLLILPWTRRAGKAIIRTLALIPSPIVIALTSVVRGYTSLHRRAAGWILDTDVPSPYLPPTGRGLARRYRRTLRDAATWRDLTWLLLNGTLGLLLCVLTFALFLGALWYFLVPLLERVVPGIDLIPVILAELLGAAQAEVVSVALGVVILVIWWQLAPTLMRGYGHLARLLLGPTERARLALRVEQLAESRAETVDAQAAEIRRIERDLHDGAQARLVALGMNLGMAEELVDRDPQAARELLAEARQSSSQALAELRDLVRGIHPPVLADRGLDGAIRALALDSPLSVGTDIELPGRPSAPVESAAYFAVAESLTNAAKHSRATMAWVTVRYTEGRLVIVVGDRGRGGASVGKAGGLHGIRRRLGVFDGTMKLTSPPGGPTVVTMEVPCELSSAKTSPS
ncbi:MAG: sensor histidine kinase [Streptosporangiales bacterium]|nr:sensor histidine kinase [Streptosporangiales bacterium]